MSVDVMTKMTWGRQKPLQALRLVAMPEATVICKPHKNGCVHLILQLLSPMLLVTKINTKIERRLLCLTHGSCSWPVVHQLIVAD